jgi:hypothetical protein
MSAMKPLLSLIPVFFLFTGCTTLRDFDSPDNPKRVLYHNWNDQVAKRFKEGTFRVTYDGLVDKASTDEAAGKITEARAARRAAALERNRELDRFLTGVDVYYEKNKNALISGRALSNTGFDIVQLGLTGSATLAGGGTSNVLAGIATAIQGTHLSIDKNLFNDNASLLIAAKMDQLRKTKRDLIEKQKIDENLDYTLDAAMRDAIEYFYAGTINGALLALYNDTGQKTAAAEADQDKQVNRLYEQNLKARDQKSVP